MLPLEDLKGKFAIVAGGVGLIGLEITKALQKLDCSVLVIDKTLGDNLLDFKTLDECVRLGPDIFINASYPKGISDHLEAFYKSTLLVAGGMARNNGGSIINLASIYGSIAPRNWMESMATISI